MKLIIKSSYEGMTAYQEVPTPSMTTPAGGIDSRHGLEAEEAKKTIEAFLDLPDVQLALEWEFDDLLSVRKSIDRLLNALEAGES